MSEEQQIDATDSAVELAAEYDVDLADVEGTGADGRIVKADVEAFLEEGENNDDQQLSTPDPAPAAEEEEPEEEPAAEEEEPEGAPVHGEQRKVAQDRMANTGGFSNKKNIIKP